MHPTPLYSGTSLTLNVSAGPAPSTYQCWLHSGHRQLGRVHLGVGAYGSQIGVHMCGEQPAAVIPMHAAGNAQLQQHCNQLAGFVNCFQVVKRLPGKGSYASTKVFEENSTSAGTMRTTLTSNVWLGTRLPHALLPGQFCLVKKTLELGFPLTMQQDDKHACLTVCSLVPLCDRTRSPRASNQQTTKRGSPSAICKTALVDGTPKRNTAAALATLIRLYSHRTCVETWP